MVNTSNKHIKLKGDRLSIEIAYPGTVYSGSRFDWNGFITGIVLDGKHTFCMPESLTPGEGSGGFGLCNEFGIYTPIGYDDAKPGEKFPKLGSGLLTRPDESSYFFFNKYEVTPFSVKITTDYDTVVFEVEPFDCKGYAVKMTKKISVDNNKLVIDYRLENLGGKTVRTEEYCHNFFAVNKNRVGTGYLLRFPYDIKTDCVPDVMDIKDREIRWNNVPKKDFKCCPKGFQNVKQHYWELLYEPERVGIREYSEFAVANVAVWGTTHVISPEVFINVNIRPGEVQEWTRKYEFFSY